MSERGSISAELVEAVLGEANRLLPDGQALAKVTGGGTFTDEQVSAAYNKAADEVLAAIGAPDQGVRAAINLIVNSGAFFLRQPDGNLAEALKKAYQEEAETVLGWARSALS